MNISNIVFMGLVLLLVIMLYRLYLLFHPMNEGYRGLSKVSEFEDALERKYTRVDREKKEVSYCIKESTLGEEGSGEELCQKMTYKYHFNNPEKVKLVKDKIETSTILQTHGLPIPKFFKLSLSGSGSQIDLLRSKMREHQIAYPIVLKQIYGTFGIDVYTHIENDEMARRTLQMFVDKGYKEIMCEEQIAGHCYRIFVFNKTIIDVIKREAPYITGDGIHSVEVLIQMRNKKQLEKKLFETKNISHAYIEKAGYKMNSILPKGKNLIISTVINMHNGAQISRVPISEVPKVNQDIFIKTNEVLGIMTSGIDYLSQDISIPYHQNNGRILEVNGTPDTEIHTIVSSQTNDPFDIYEKIADVVFI